MRKHNRFNFKLLLHLLAIGLLCLLAFLLTVVITGFVETHWGYRISAGWCQVLACVFILVYRRVVSVFTKKKDAATDQETDNSNINAC